MNRKFHITLVIIAGLVLQGLLQQVLADDDYIEARRLSESGKILSLEVILENIRQNYPGKILEAELEHEDDHIVYEIEILSADGVVKEVYIDARTGKLLFVKEDND